MNLFHMQLKVPFIHCSMITFFTLKLVLVMSLSSVNFKTALVKAGMFALVTMEPHSLPMDLSIVVVKLGFVNSCEGTIITEQCLPSRGVLSFIYLPSLLHAFFRHDTSRCVCNSSCNHTDYSNI